jgi:hypothetical protein
MNNTADRDVGDPRDVAGNAVILDGSDDDLDFLAGAKGQLG